jgi:hypothetical protein
VAASCPKAKTSQGSKGKKRQSSWGKDVKKDNPWVEPSKSSQDPYTAAPTDAPVTSQEEAEKNANMIMNQDATSKPLVSVQENSFRIGIASDRYFHIVACV